MRGKCKVTPTNGETRQRTKFLLFPKCIDGTWRWFEVATYTEEFWRDYVNYEALDFECWSGVRWLSA